MPTDLLSQLTPIVGAEYLMAGSAPFAIHRAVPDMVVAPGSVAELAQVLALAHESGARVVPWGGGTQQRWGNPLPAGDARPLLVVCTTRLNRVIEHEPADLTISVEAGMTMAALGAHLAEHGQMLPVDVPRPTRATIGGVLATAMDGPRRLGYGTLRDLLIGIQVVEATGRPSKAGGMVVKNVSGFDMMKLYLGSFGTLAIIVSANFKLIPRPRAAASVWCAFETTASAFALVDALAASQLTPVAVEYIGVTERSTDGNSPGSEDGDSRPAVLPSSRPPVFSPQSFPAPHNLAVLAEGVPLAVARHVRDVTALARGAGAVAVQVLEGDMHRAAWEQIAELPQTADPAPDEAVLRLACLPARLGPVLEVAARLAHRQGMPLLIAARALSGVAYVRAQASAPGAIATYCTTLREAAPDAGLTVLAWPPAAPDLPRWSIVTEGTSVMQRIKREFDPMDMLNPGRMH